MADEKPDLLKVLLHYRAEVQEHRTQSLIRCVVHEETRASMSVNLTKQLVNCMACGFSGDVYSIVMSKENCGFRQALEFAQQHFGTAGSSGTPARRGMGGGRRGGGYRPRIRRRGLGG